MSDKKKIVIEDCFNCPYRLNTSFGDRCTLRDYKIEDLYTIPECCPLPKNDDEFRFNPDWELTAKDFKNAIDEAVKAERERVAEFLREHLKPVPRRSYWGGIEIDQWVLDNEDYRELKQKYGDE